MVRSISSLISGVAVGGLAVALIRIIALTMYPIEPNLSPEDLDHVMANMEKGYYFFIIASHIIGAFAAGIVGAVIVRKNKRAWGLAAAGILLVIIAYNNYQNGNPDWVKLLDISLTSLAGYLGARIPRSS